MTSISKMSAEAFTLFVKYLNDLRTDVLDNPLHKLTPDSFLIFLDKIKNIEMTRSDLNDMILRNMSKVNIDELHPKKILNIY